MRILLYTDVHFCTYSSILRTRGKKYSTRLENLIQSVSWAEKLSEQENCDAVITLGDFFDKPHLTDEELTALKEVYWNAKIPHYALIGNHESSVGSLEFTSTQALTNGVTPFYIISNPYKLPLSNGALYFIPYTTEDNRKPLETYLKELGYDNSKLNIVLSHNDLKGIQMGRVQSTVGFDVDEIEKVCSLFLNGHLHNGTWVTKKILNLGNLTGQNFGEDAFKYKHQVLILDTDTRELSLVENPYSLKFYQMEIQSKKDLAKIDTLGVNSIVSIRYKEELYDDLMNKIKKCPNIIESRSSLLREVVEGEPVQIDKVEDFTINHLEKFKEFVIAKLGDDQVVQEELASLGIQ